MEINEGVHPVLPILFINLATATFISGITSTVKSSSTDRLLMFSNSIHRHFRLQPCMFSNTTEDEAFAGFSAMSPAQPASSWSSLFGTRLPAFCKASVSPSAEREISHMSYWYTFPGIKRFLLTLSLLSLPKKRDHLTNQILQGTPAHFGIQNSPDVIFCGTVGSLFGGTK